MNLEFTKASEDDIAGIVDLHLLKFTNFFLSTLGPSFLKAYYKAFLLMKDDAIIIVAKQEGKVVGFAAVMFESIGAMKKIVASSPLTFSFVFLKIALGNPKGFLGLVNRVLNGKGLQIAGPELLSIATSEQVRGLGSNLLKQTEEIVASKGYNNISLTTDFEDNARAIRFYEKNGYEEVGKFETNANRVMIRFNKKI